MAKFDLNQYIPSFKPQNQLAIYIHIPYCLSKCPYCDFNSHGIRGEKGNFEERYTKSLVREIEITLRAYSSLHATGFSVSSIYFGGGTPSVFSASSIGRILGAIKAQSQFLPETEVSMEVNPATNCNQNYFEELSYHGVNRISLGAQSFSPKKLRLLRRAHAVAQIRSTIEAINYSSINKFSLDLILALRGETLTEWRRDLVEAVGYSPQHLSTYSLTIESNTHFAKLAKMGLQNTSGVDTSIDLYEETIGYLAKLGYQHYEVSAFAKPEFECAHNLNYWKGGSYLGFGAGAHSYHQLQGEKDITANGLRWSNEMQPQGYISKTEESYPTKSLELIEREQALMEFFLARFRLKEGSKVSELVGLMSVKQLSEVTTLAKMLAGQGLVNFSNEENISLTTKGFALLNEIIDKFCEI